MEPFGLLNFLQSLLNSPTQNDPEPTTPTDAPVTAPEPIETADEHVEKENACARFLENHDARARKMKR